MDGPCHDDASYLLDGTFMEQHIAILPTVCMPLYSYVYTQWNPEDSLPGHRQQQLEMKEEVVVVAAAPQKAVAAISKAFLTTSHEAMLVYLPTHSSKLYLAYT